MSLPILKPAQLLQNLRTYTFPKPYQLNDVWPIGRRSAVLVVLFIGQFGELRVLLTRRSKKLKSFAGHVSFPGGKADNEFESFEQVARREAEEEIGLPRDPQVLREQYGLQLEQITLDAPCYLSKTFLSVKPVVTFLSNCEIANDPAKYTTPLTVTNQFARLNPGETDSMFSIPFRDLLGDALLPKTTYPVINTNTSTGTNMGPTRQYLKYHGRVKNWGGLPWEVRHFYYPRHDQNEALWLQRLMHSNTHINEKFFEGTQLRDVWGLTCKIMYDLSLVAHYSTFEAEDIGLLIRDTHFAHEHLLYGLKKYGGQMRAEGRSEWEKKMIEGSRLVSYRDVLPAFYMDFLKSKRRF